MHSAGMHSSSAASAKSSNSNLHPFCDIRFVSTVGDNFLFLQLCQVQSALKPLWLISVRFKVFVSRWSWNGFEFLEPFWVVSGNSLCARAWACVGWLEKVAQACQALEFLQALLEHTINYILSSHVKPVIELTGFAKIWAWVALGIGLTSSGLRVGSGTYSSFSSNAIILLLKKLCRCRQYESSDFLILRHD